MNLNKKFFIFLSLVVVFLVAVYSTNYKNVFEKTFASAGYNTPAFVQVAGSELTSGGTSLSTSISPTGAGNLLVVCVNTGSGSISSITDNKSSSYELIQKSSYGNFYMYYLKNAQAGITNITTNFGYAGANMVVAEYSGVDTTSPLDRYSTYNNGFNGGNNWTSGSTSETSQSDELVVGCAMDLYLINNTFSSAENFTARKTQSNALFLQDKNVSSIGAYRSTGSRSGNYGYQIVSTVATFKASVSGSSPVVETPPPTTETPPPTTPTPPPPPPTTETPATTQTQTTTTNTTPETTSSTSGNSSPQIFFSDLTWGPKTGWEGSSTKGAAVTIWGKNFGSSRGSSYITINGTNLTSSGDYAEWGALGPARDLERITFWINSSANNGSGEISVTVGGVRSNTIPFTITSGTIYFVSPSGNNSNNGLYSSNTSGNNGPFRDIYKFDPAQNPSGDGQYIVYVRGGTYTTKNSDGYFTSSRGAGGPTKQKALIAYPGETPILSNAPIWYNRFETSSTKNSYFTFSKLNGTGGSGAFPTQWGDYNRFIGNNLHDYLGELWAGVITPVNSTYNYIYGNLLENNGYNSMKHDIYVQTLDGFGAPSQYNYIAWNEISNPTTSDRGASVFISSHGTSPNYTKDIYVHSNYFHDGNSNFIYMADSSTIGNMYVYNNVFENSTDTTVGAVLMNIGSTNAYIYNNTFYQPAAASVAAVQEFCNCTMNLKNNIFYLRPGQRAISWTTYYGGSVSSDYDLIYSPDSVSLPSGAGITRTNSLTSNPNFVDIASHNFSLKSASLAINSGTSAVSSIVNKDYNGLTRPEGTAYDMGAFEYSTLSTNSTSGQSSTQTTQTSTSAPPASQPAASSVSVSSGLSTGPASQNTTIVDSNTRPYQNIRIKPTETINKNLFFGSKGEEVYKLQRFLLAYGYILEDSVTGYFGYITQSAVKKFQTANNIVSSGTPASTGFGVVGPITRKIINAIIGGQGTIDAKQQLENAIKLLNELMIKLQKIRGY